jgi:hypothetical protein
LAKSRLLPVVCTLLSFTLIGACGRSLPQSTSTSTVWRPPPTPLASASAPARAASATATLARGPTFTPTPFIPEASLSPSGPWLIGSEFTRHGNISLPIVADLNGTGYLHLPLPQLDYYAGAWFSPRSIAPRGGLVAFRVMVGQDNYELWLLRLPDGAIVREIPLLSEEAMQAIADWPLTPTPEYPSVPTAPVLQSLLEEGALLWSPNARYLAMAAAIDGPTTDVYVYDTVTDQLRRLTFGDTQTYIMDWSPDSRWIVHASAQEVYDYGLVATAIWAVDVHTDQVVYLYPYDSYPSYQHILGWASNTAFVVEDGQFEAPFRALRVIDVTTGSRRFLTDMGHLDSAFDPESGSLWISPQHPFGIDEGATAGVYRLSFHSPQPSLMLAGDNLDMEWIPELSRLAVSDGPGHFTLYTTSGIQDVSFTLAEPFCSQFSPSPDGQYSVLDAPGAMEIRDRSGQLLRAFPGARCGFLYWLADASMFFRLIGRPCCSEPTLLYRHSRSDDWDPIIVQAFPPHVSVTDVVPP